MEKQKLLQELSQQVGKLLLDNDFTICTAESCTGGMIASTLTDIAGSSAYVLGGVVAYSNEIKQNLLEVQAETLIQYGAVSEATAKEMAIGAKNLFQTDIAISVTGIAGPGGGTNEKPVGLTYIGLAFADSVMAHQFIWGNNRIDNKIASVEAALQIVINVLQK